MVQKKRIKKSRASPGVGSALREVPCLSRLEPAALTELQEKTREEQYRRGQILFKEGAVCEEIFVITEGSVKVYRLSDDGRQQTLWILGASDCFCLAPFFHRARYPATAQCMTDVRVLILKDPEYLSLLREAPGVTSVVAGCLCDRVNEMARLIETSSRRHVRGRLAQTLLELADSRGVRTTEGILLDSALTHEEIAACVGTAREVISRTLEQWQRDGLVRLGRGRLVLLDPSRLKAICLPLRSPRKLAR